MGASPKKSRASAAPPDEVASRVDEIARMMTALEWERGHSATVMAARWGLAVGTVEGYAVEAWRRVTAAVQDPAELRDEVAVHLRQRLRVSDSDRGAASLGDTLTRILGARAPERSEVDVTMRVAGMEPKAALARVDEALAKLLDYREKLVAEIDAAEKTEGIA